MKSLIKIWWLALAAKLVLAALFPLSQDEAYYWVWSKHLQLSYFDHPAMVAWLMWLGHWLEPLGQAVRWPAVILGHVTLLLWILLLEQVLSANDPIKNSKLRYFLWLSLSSPMLGFGSLLTTPDVPVIFFWSLSAYLIARILVQQNVKDYFYLGISLGLGFCSKYHIVLFVFSILAWLIFEKRWQDLSLKGISLTFIAGLIFSSPVLIWNYQNDFQSFRFQLDHGLGASSWEFFWTYSYVVAQVLLLGPVTLWFAWKTNLPKAYTFLKFLAWFPLGFFLLSSFKNVVEVNWPIVAFPAMYAMAVIGAKSLRPLWWSIAPWALVAGLVTIQNFHQYTDQLPDRVIETHYFDPVLHVLKQQSLSPIYFGSYQMASRVWWENKAPAKKLFQINRHDFFDELQAAPNSESTFYVVKENWVHWPDWVENSNYETKKLQDIPPKFELFQVVKR